MDPPPSSPSDHPFMSDMTMSRPSERAAHVSRVLRAFAPVPLITLLACHPREDSTPAADSSGATATSLARSSAVSASLDARVPELLTKYRIASVALAQIEDGHVVLERAYGQQSAGVRANPSTLYGLASVTKPVSAEVLLRLVGAGRLSLDEPMASAWIDPDVAEDPRAKKLTMRHALAHQTGLPNWRGHAPGGKLAFSFSPGTAYAYAGEGYDYAARFAERKLGRNFESLAQDLVFDPLGMKSTSYSWRDWMRGRLAVPFDSAGHWGAPQVEDSSHWNAGNNLITTAGDYARFVISVMDGEGLPPALASERLQPARGPQFSWKCPATMFRCPLKVTQALGWLRVDYERGPVFLHTGLNGRPGGERTIAYFDSAGRRGAVVFTSGENGVKLYVDVLRILDPSASILEYLELR